jgi:4-hydroxybenzoate polyprenyltransferase
MSGHAKSILALFRPFTLLPPILAAQLFGTLPLHRFEVRVELIFAALTLASANAASNVLNQYFDLELDRISAPSRPLPMGKVKSDTALTIGVLLYGSSTLLSSVVLKMSGSILFTILVHTILFLTWAYSAPPLRLKRYMVLNNMTIATPRGGLGILAAYTIFGDPLDFEILLAVLGFGLFVFGGNTCKDFRDEKADRAFEIRNFVTVYSADRAARVMVPFLYFPIAVLALARPIALLAFPLSMLLHYIVVARRDLRARISWHLFYIEMGVLMVLYTVPALGR